LKAELGVLICDDDDRTMDEHHTLQVKFWAQITVLAHQIRDPRRNRDY